MIARRAILNLVAALWAITACATAAEDARDYTISLRVIETREVTTTEDPRQSNTTCSAVGDDVDCETRANPKITITRFIQLASDDSGKEWEIMCIPRAAQRFAVGAGEGMQAQAGTLTNVERGCRIPNGVYRAKLSGDRFKLLVPDQNGKEHAVTFLRRTPNLSSTSGGAPTGANDAVAAQYMITSAPSGADISIDGAFVGNTPSQIPLRAGKHLVSVAATGFKPWSRDITVIGGSNASLNAILEKQP